MDRSYHFRILSNSRLLFSCFPCFGDFQHRAPDVAFLKHWSWLFEPFHWIFCFFTLFVIDILQFILISLFPTPFGHIQFLGSARQNSKLILRLSILELLIWAKLILRLLRLSILELLIWALKRPLFSRTTALEKSLANGKSLLGHKTADTIILHIAKLFTAHSQVNSCFWWFCHTMIMPYPQLKRIPRSI